MAILLFICLLAASIKDEIKLITPPNLPRNPKTMGFVATPSDTKTWHNNTFSFQATNYYRSVIMRSSDLKTWTPIITNRGDSPITIVIDGTATNNYFFYKPAYK